MSTSSKGPAIEAFSLPGKQGTGYPAPFDKPLAGREKRALGAPFNLTNLGVNMITLAHGAISSQRHWHTKQDEFVYMVDGELVLVTDEGEQIMSPGMIVGFAAGITNGHHLVNRSGRKASFIVVSDKTPEDEGGYPDIDMLFVRKDGQDIYVHKDGTPYDINEKG